MSRTTDELVSEYLGDLRAELGALPRSARQEVLDEIATHIAEARANLAVDSEVEVRALLDRVGEPADIAAEARERFGVKPRERTWREVAALVLLPIGGVVIPGVGWIVGVILLWASDAWTTRDKLLGTFVPPGGLVFPLLMLQTLGSSERCVTRLDANGREVDRTCSGGPSEFAAIFWPTLLIALVVATVATTIYLARRSARTRVAPA